MKILASYIKTRYRLIILLFLLLFICVTVFLLYDIPFGAVIYSSLLCSAVTLGFDIFDFISYRNKHRVLKSILTRITQSCDNLPEPRGEIEADYTALIRELYSYTRKLNDIYTERGRERDDYYTLWMHQIKTPIAAMHLILQDEDTPTGREIDAQLFMIERYVGMALAYLRTESKTTDFLFREYRLDGIVRQAVRKYAPMFIRKKLTLDFRPSDITIITDEKWLCFVIEQLLSNAVKYTNSGTVSIYTEGNDTLVIRDTGIGIAPGDLPRIFDEGFTGYNGHTDKRASGIGLYLTGKVIKQLGHGITFESTVGVGTTVKLNLHTDRTLFD